MASVSPVVLIRESQVLIPQFIYQTVFPEPPKGPEFLVFGIQERFVLPGPYHPTGADNKSRCHEDINYAGFSICLFGGILSLLCISSRPLGVCLGVSSITEPSGHSLGPLWPQATLRGC